MEGNIYSIIFSLITTVSIYEFFLKRLIENRFNLWEEKQRQIFDEKIKKLDLEEGRLNMESTSYVNIITQQRIEWLEVVRTDFSKIVSYYKAISFNYNDSQEIFIYNFMFNNNEKMKEFLNSAKMTIEDFYLLQDKRKRDITILMEHIIMLKLRLNPQEDKEIIQKLEFLEKGVMSNFNRDKFDQLLKEMEKLIQEMLKKEWEKVKKEIKYRGCEQRKTL